MFPESFSKSSARLSNVLFLTIYPSTSVPVYYPTFLEYGVPVFGMYQYISDGASSSEAIVIRDKEYNEKAKALQEDQGTYKTLKTDPTQQNEDQVDQPAQED